MSSKATIILTKDNEHVYNECIEYGPSATCIEISRKNVIEYHEDDWDLFIVLKPDSELAQWIESKSVMSFRTAPFKQHLQSMNNRMKFLERRLEQFPEMTTHHFRIKGKMKELENQIAALKTLIDTL